MKLALLHLTQALELFEHRLSQAEGRFLKHNFLDKQTFEALYSNIRRLGHEAVVCHRALLSEDQLQSEDVQTISEWIQATQQILTYLVASLKKDLLRLQEKERNEAR